MRISQREARRLRKRVSELEATERRRRGHWAHEFPGGTIITSAKFDAASTVPVAIKTARLLKHAVVASCDTDGTVYFFALPLPSEG